MAIKDANEGNVVNKHPKIKMCPIFGIGRGGVFICDSLGRYVVTPLGTV
ncbi:MAG: hypothetical protein KBC27_02705 [Rickettsiales bacterium]|nr:hypothetical protein [Rickettsiales bacterium]